jgi:hypothetical protein
MKPLAEIVWQRLTGLMPGELKKAELPWLATPFQHLSLLANRRATMIVNRVRLFAFLFAMLTPMWIVVDFLVFPAPLWWQLALMRLLASAAFASLVLFYQPRGHLLDAYRAMALLFIIPTLFYMASYSLMGSHELTGLSAAVSSAMRLCMFEGQNFSLRRGDVVLGKSGAIGFSCTEGESVFVCFSMEQANS